MKRSHHDLQVWQEGMSLAKDIYTATSSFPKDEVFGLTSQMRRSAVPVPSNIAEGAARGGKREFLQFLVISRGSLMELETQLMLAEELGYLSNCRVLLEKINKIYAMLNGLIAVVKNRTGKK